MNPQLSPLKMVALGSTFVIFVATAVVDVWLASSYVDRSSVNTSGLAAGPASSGGVLLSLPLPDRDGWDGHNLHHCPSGKLPSGKLPSGKLPSGKFPSGRLPCPDSLGGKLNGRYDGD